MNFPPDWATGAWTLLLPLAVLWWRTRGRPRTAGDAWHAGWDTLLMVLSGVGLAVGCFYWASLFPLDVGQALSADVSDYCRAVASARLPEAGNYPLNRSPLVGMALGWLARSQGVIHAIQLGAMAGTMLVGSGLYLWGRAVTDQRAGGVATVVLSLTVAPLVLLSRHLTFYPELAGVLAISAGCVAVALRTNALPALLAAGVSTGLVLALDPRLLLIGLSLAGLLLVGSLFGPWRWLPARVAAVVLPVMASWPIPGWANAQLSSMRDPNTAFVGYVSLISGVYLDHDQAATEAIRRVEGPADFAWGHSFADLQPAVDRLFALREIPLNPMLTRTPVLALDTVQDQWLLLVAALGLVGVGSLWRSPRRLLAAGVLALPFWVILLGAIEVLPRPRTLANGSLVLPVMLVLGIWAAGVSRLPKRGAWVAVAVLAVLTAGMLPSWVHPRAGWRMPGTAGVSGMDPDALIAEMRRDSPQCDQALGEDVAAGRMLDHIGPPGEITPRRGVPIPPGHTGPLPP